MTRRKERRKGGYEIRFVPSEEGIPDGDLHPFRRMDEQEREDLLVEAAVRMLRECRTPPAQGEASGNPPD